MKHLYMEPTKQPDAMKVNELNKSKRDEMGSHTSARSNFQFFVIWLLGTPSSFLISLPLEITGSRSRVLGGRAR